MEPQRQDIQKLTTAVNQLTRALNKTPVDGDIDHVKVFSISAIRLANSVDALNETLQALVARMDVEK